MELHDLFAGYRTFTSDEELASVPSDQLLYARPGTAVHFGMEPHDQAESVSRSE
ncbi:hypothetical protein [Sciscionella marina]|uniref:hypothetical protein n=1 Tax=Sciscionella marina TaxID=508770 RepID=UPI00037CB3C9|nr:hypothetical protein [Sciscionella marina]